MAETAGEDIDRMSARPTGMLPSGDQIEIHRGGHHAVIVEVSGGLRTYEVDGHSLVDGYAADEVCTGARGQLLVPWPNRLRDGRYRFEGETFQVPLSEPERLNALHGFLRWENWHVAQRADDCVVMEHTLHPRAGYPFALHLAAEYRLDGAGLVCRTTATNVGTRACPYGIGAHPYLHVGADTIDVCEVQAPGKRYLISDERGIPTGAAGVAGTDYDFRSRRLVGEAVIDTAFTDLDRESDGRAWVRLWRADERGGVGLWMDEQYPFYMLFTGDTLPEEHRRRRSLAVEPMTCAPNAFASGHGLVTLAPGERWVGTWGIAPLGQGNT